MQINILAVGDVVGQPGLDYLSRRLPTMISMRGIDFTVVNGENVSGGGLFPQEAEEIFNAGADVITLGNHTWGRREIIPYLDEMPHILRPLNIAPGVPGHGFVRMEREFGTVLIANLIGRLGMDFGPDNPLRAMDTLLQEQPQDTITLIDFHAEATSEKLALAHYLDGRVSAVWGTHTHVQTSDAMLLPKGTGYLTDLGMTGAANSILGVKIEQSVEMFYQGGGPKPRLTPAKGPCKLECAIFTIDTDTKLCTDVEAMRIYD